MEGQVAARWDDGSLYLSVRGAFAYGVSRQLKEVYDALGALPSKCRVVVDLTRVHYLDSVALGMLLLMREEAASMLLRVQAPSVAKVLEVAQFHRHFELQNLSEPRDRSPAPRSCRTRGCSRWTG
ncbi:MAG: STAS domain-containing protein [Myxococcota bacterium]